VGLTKNSANWMAGMTAHDKRVMDFIGDKQIEITERMRLAAPDAVFSVLLLFQPVTQTIVDQSIARGGNVLGLENIVSEDEPAIMWLIAVTVDTEENQEIIQPLTMEFRNAVEEYATLMGLNKNWPYLNYAMGDQDPLASYGEENLSIIRAAAEKYDPTKVFQKLRGSGFKIPV
jgi:hypothetical protein